MSWSVVRILSVARDDREIWRDERVYLIFLEHILPREICRSNDISLKE